LSLVPIVVIVRGSCAYSPLEIAKGNSSKLLMTCVPSVMLVLMVLLCRVRRVMPISA
jgi:hypothetical protein